MANLAVGIIIISILGFSIRKIIIAKKSGVKCIGCEFEGSCNHHHDETLSDAPTCCSHCDPTASSCSGCSSK